MKRFLRAEAEVEMAEAAQWYEEHQAGLAEAFLAELESTFAAIEENPRRFPELGRGVRRALTKRFPYSVFFYIFRESTVVILAVLHQARDPARWKERR